MPTRHKYRKKQSSTVTAVQLNLDTPGFAYQKWGGTQRCNAGDWLVDNNGDCYTVSEETFARTYREVGPGVYHKSTAVWAEPAERPGTIKTQEGETAYEVGDMIVYNNENETDGYAMSRETFFEQYERAD